jgi:hypothetical protein
MIEELEVIKTDFYIRLANEDAMATVLSHFYKQDTETTVDEDTGEENTTNVGDPYLVPNTSDYAMDIVGTLHEPTGATLTDDEGMEYPEMQSMTGWHVNIRIRGGILNKDAEDAEAPDTLRDIVETLDTSHGVTPETPMRVWL